MANRQPGHYTFGRRNSVDIYKILDMLVEDENESGLVLPFTRVYDTDYKLPRNRHGIFNGSWVGDNQLDISDTYGPVNNPDIPTGINFYTGVVVALDGTATSSTNWGAPILAKSPRYGENVIGVVVGGTGPTLANQARGPAKTGGVLPGYENEGLVIQYAGQCPVLLVETDSVSVRGRFLETSPGTSGTAVTDVTSGIYQFGLCLTNSFASGMTAGHGPGLTGLLGNYVNAFIRPVETE